MKRYLNLVPILFSLLAWSVPAWAQVTITPKALVIAAAPAQVMDTSGNLTAKPNFPGTTFQVNNVATVLLLVYHYSTGIDYPLLKYSDTAGNSFAMQYPRSTVFGANSITVIGNVAWKTPTDNITFNLTPGAVSYHLALSVKANATGKTECIVNTDLDPNTSTVKGLGLSTVSVEDIQDAASSSTASTANGVISHLAFAPGNDFWYSDKTAAFGETLYQVEVHTGKLNFSAFDSDITSWTETGTSVHITGHIHGAATTFVEDFDISGKVTVTEGGITDSVQVVSPGQVTIAGHTLQDANPQGHQ